MAVAAKEHRLDSRGSLLTSPDPTLVGNFKLRCYMEMTSLNLLRVDHPIITFHVKLLKSVKVEYVGGAPYVYHDVLDAGVCNAGPFLTEELSPPVARPLIMMSIYLFTGPFGWRDSSHSFNLVLQVVALLGVVSVVTMEVAVAPVVKPLSPHWIGGFKKPFLPDLEEDLGPGRVEWGVGEPGDVLLGSLCPFP
ncbi:hypothetical protein BHE74_00010443 [Ensete ventricosum]|nr:hypothetical protein BHE74_00010443 [Ensete ventricosum]RZS19971.1 hypothetical protein BHM03_00052436 [Ensete ventricosum]